MSLPLARAPGWELTTRHAGFLTGAYKSYEEFQQDGDARANMPRFSKENFDHNLALVGQFEKFAARKGCTAGQLTLAWLMAQGPNIIPIPGVSLHSPLIAFGAPVVAELPSSMLNRSLFSHRLRRRSILSRISLLLRSSWTRPS